jgi:hypothetical protein
MAVTFLLGFVAAWRHDFGTKEASILNRTVLLYAVPLALFAGTVTSSRRELSQDVPLAIALCVVIIGLYALVFLLFRIACRLQMSVSALAALTASAPAVPFVGPAVLGDLLGRSSAIPIAIAGRVINLTVVPVTISLSRIGYGRRRLAEKELSLAGREAFGVVPASHLSILATKIAETVLITTGWQSNERRWNKMTCLNDLGRRSFLEIAAALGGASTVRALPSLAGAQDTPQQTDTPAITLQDVPFSSGAKLTIERHGSDRPFWHQSSLHPEPH